MCFSTSFIREKKKDEKKPTYISTFNECEGKHAMINQCCAVFLTCVHFRK